ncbi:MAG: heteromeric transposase endonuclease subunit TnsA [Burkholderiales bacterium]|nr:heteromeric transposase endonuclease subunit TnsA [Burkholderiales bacterium]
MKMNLPAQSSKLSDGPVRRIGISSRSITGTMPNGNRYESSLERDLMILLNFDPLVDFFTPQPLTLSYQMPDLSWHKYTPDGLIEYRKDVLVHDPRPVLIEVKYREAFEGKSKEWLPKFRAAHRHAKENGWIFQILTEEKIRTPFLDNVKFLTPYLKNPDYPHMDWLSDELNKLKTSTVKEIISLLYKDKWNQARLVQSLWALIARREIGCDLSVPLTTNTTIWAL